MEKTGYLPKSPAVEEKLDELRLLLTRQFGDELVGLYAYGSLVTGDFDPSQSDLDLLAALSREVQEQDLPSLQALHARFVQKHPEWDDRVEVAYVSTTGLRTFKSRASTAAIVSPGEPLHLTQVGREWLIDYYIVREQGVPLLGPPPETFVDAISRDEFTQAVRDHLETWREPLPWRSEVGPQRYAVLTMCRGLYALRYGQQPSKKQAAQWAESEFPKWAPLIHRALAWAKNDRATESDRLETAGFIQFVLDAASHAGGPEEEALRRPGGDGDELSKCS
jgi:predicted nucleotidyltransferase